MSTDPQRPTGNRCRHGFFYPCDYCIEAGEDESPAPQSPQGSPSEARGSQSHPHPVAEGRQSPGLEEAAFQAWWSKEVEKDEEFPSRYSAAIAAWMERAALAAPGTPIEAAEVEKWKDLCRKEQDDKLRMVTNAGKRILALEKELASRPAIEKAAREAAAFIEKWRHAWCGLDIVGELAHSVECREAGEILAALSGLPPSPIERAAREYVEAHLAPLESVLGGQRGERFARLRAAVDGSGLPQEQAPDPRTEEWAFRDGFYAGAGYMGWSDADAAGCDAQIGEAQEKAWEKRRPAQGEPAAGEGGGGEPLPSVGGPAGQKKGEERP